MTAETSLEARFKAFVASPLFPCVGAKAALGRDQLCFHRCRSITSAWDDVAVVQKLIAFAHAQRRKPRQFTSFVVLFDGPRTLSEAQYEAALWERLQSMSDKDAWMGQPPATGMSADPAAPDFALSFGGQSFFAVGLHPRASRKARRFVAPAIVFNLHSQFAHLRATGRYEKMRATILERDLRLQGSVNPMLARHGTTSEARQYSGRAVEGEWRCPFRARRRTNDPFESLGGGEPAVAAAEPAADAQPASPPDAPRIDSPCLWHGHPASRGPAAAGDRR